MKRAWRELVATVAAAARHWSHDGGPRLAAALAYYALFSLAPLVVIAISVAGLAIGRDAASRELVAQFEALVGMPGARVVEGFLAAPEPGAASRWATWIGAATLLLGASGVFGELQAAMNQIWEVEPRERAGWRARLRRRFVSFAMVLGTGFLLLVSLVASAALAAAGSYLLTAVPGAEPLWRIVDALLGFVLPTLLFGLIFRLVPDAEVGWRSAWTGALVTAMLFGLSRMAIAFYLGRSALDSVYGAAASLVAVVAWVYFSAQILFLGAELTRALEIRRTARAPRPREGARAAPAAAAHAERRTAYSRRRE